MVREWRVFALVALLLLAPALVLGFGDTDSAILSYVWTKQLAAEVARGVIYPRWLPGSFGGLGSPAFYFYPPITYLAAGLFAQVLPVANAVAATAATFVLASGLSMYAWLRGKTPHARLAAVLYMAAPYHMIDLYVRGALAEAAAFVWLPLVALGVERLAARRGGLLLCLAYAGLIATHLPMAVLASIFLIPPLVLLRRPLEPDFVVGALGAGLLGLMLASPYLLPALTLREAIHSEVFTSPHFDPRNWSPWQVAPGNAGRFLHFAALALGWTGVALAARARPGTRTWARITIVAAAFALALAPQAWALPILRNVQFPWRLLAIVEFAAISAVALASSRRRLPLAIGAALLAGAALTPMELRGAPPPKEIDASLPDGVEYLPAGFHGAPLVTGLEPDLSALAGPVVRGSASLVEAAPGGELTIRVLRPGVVTLRRANFPAWRVRGPRGEVPIAAGPLVSFRADPGVYVLDRVLLPQERLGIALALAAVLILLTSEVFGARVRLRGLVLPRRLDREPRRPQPVEHPALAE